MAVVRFIDTRLGRCLTRAGAVVVVLCLFSSCGVLRRIKNRAAHDALPAAGTEASAPKIQTATSADDLTPGVAPAGIAAEKGSDVSAFVPAEGWRAPLTGWKRSATEAIRDARAQNKPLFVAVTNRQIEASQQFESAFLGSKEFREATGDTFVMLHLDYGDKETLQSDYYRNFKSRLSVSGYPTLMILLPDGTELLRLKGYIPDWKARHIQGINDAKPHIEQAIALRRKKMESTGYRLWSSAHDRKVFARLTSLDANQATFLGEWGEEFRTFLNRLSEEDQKWIAANSPHHD